METKVLEPSELIGLHDCSSKHRERLEEGKLGLCFYCISALRFEEVKEWIDQQTTALCPKCGIDAVIPTSDLNKFPRLSSMTNSEVLRSLSVHWFGTGRPLKLDTLTISAVQHESYMNAARKGFWDRRDGQRQNVGEKLMLVCCEVAEAMEETRKKGVKLNETYYVDGKPEGFGIELADAIIRILDLAEREGVDMTECIRTKLAFNRTRPHMHGKKS